MKLKNIVLMLASTTLCAWTCIVNAGVLAQGGSYVGLAGGWGEMLGESSENLASFFDVAQPGAEATSGGFAGRIYMGYLKPITTSWLIGPEVGYSYYRNNNYTLHSYIANDSNLNIKQSGYGIDILLNATYMLNDTVSVAVKPGIQYAVQKFDSNDTTGVYFPGSTNVNKVLPEVNVEANWQAFADKPLFLGASYQYVFGDDASDVIDRAWGGHPAATSREMLALNLEYLFN